MNDNGFYLYKCDVCGQIIASRKPLDNPISCCNAPMHLIIPSSTDAAVEKHVPVYELYGETIVVNVGETAHPMEEKHHIEWIAIITDKGIQIKFINNSGLPTATFKLHNSENVKTILEYCNIHGLWSCEM